MMRDHRRDALCRWKFAVTQSRWRSFVFTPSSMACV